MPRFSANLSHLFTEQDLLERPAAAAAAGFKGIEMLFPYEAKASELKAASEDAGVPWLLINAPRGDDTEVGLSAVPGRRDAFRASMDTAFDYAGVLSCKFIHVLAGLVPEDDWPAALDTYVENLAWAAGLAAKEKITLLIEPIALDGYFLTRPDDAVSVIEDIDHKNLRLLYDLYQAQLVQGGLTDFLETYLDMIAHIQVAGVPGRHEPDALGEVNWRYLFDLLDAHGYTGWVGAEYDPRGNTLTGLAWAKPWGIGTHA